MSSRRSARRRVSAAALIACALLPASCALTEGTFDVAFLWPHGPPVLTAPLYVFGRVEERDVSPSTPGNLLELVGPISYDGHGASVPFGTVPNGQNRVVIVELHETQSSDSQVFYYGISSPFALQPGRNSDVQVLLQLESAPGIMTPGGAAPTSSVAVIGPVTPGYVKDPSVSLILKTDTGVAVRLANDVDEVDSATAQPLSTLSAATGGGRLLAGWNLNSGLAATASGSCDVTVAPQGCTRTVFAQFVDANGYGSPVVSTNVILDEVAPSLVDPPASLPGAKAGDTLSISLVPDEPLSAIPAATVTGGAGSGAIELSYISGTHYIFTHTVLADDSNGNFGATFALVDLAGNTTASAPPAPITFVVDTVPPAITDLVVTPAEVSAIAGFNTVTLSFDVAKPVPGDELTVTVDGTVLPQQQCVELPTTPPGYTCTYTVPTTETSGTKPVTVSTVDEVGNTGFASASIVFDLDKPEILSSAATPPTVGLGQQEILSVVPSKALAMAPTLTVTGPATLAFTTGRAGTTYTYELSTAGLGASAAGTYSTALSLIDPLGNEATYPGPSFVVDTVAPALTNLVTLNGEAPATRFSAVNGYNQLVVKFDWAGWMSLAPVAVTATLGNVVLVCSVPAPSTAPNAYACPHTVTTADPEGQLPVSVRAVDEAGNAASASATVTFDFTAPTLPVDEARPETVGANQNETLILTASEALGADPIVTASGAEVPAFAVEGGTEYELVAPISTSPAVMGSVSTSVQLVDLVGNASVVAGPSFTVDSVVPTISGLTVTPAQVSGVAAFNTVTVTFGVTKLLQAGQLTVLVDGNPVQACTPSQAMPPTYSCTWTVPPSATSGTKTVTVTTLDEAGNSGFASTTVVFDLDAPQILSSAATPSIVGIGQPEIISVVANKPLATAPALNVSGPASIAFVAGTVGSTYTYQASTTGLPPSASGTYSTSFTLTDLLGNVSTYPGPSFVVDTVAPEITNLLTLNGNAVPAARFSAVSGYNQLVVTFDWAGWMNNPPVSVTATLATETLACSAPSPWAAPYAYSCPHTVTTADQEGQLAVSVRAVDEAGNAASAAATVTLDFTAPTLPLGLANPPVVGVGQDETLTLTASEPLGGTPIVTATGAEAPVFAAEAGTTYELLASISASPAVIGSVETSVQLVDLVGNASVVAGPSFNVDTVVPTISGLAVTPAEVSAAAGFNTVTVTFGVAKRLSSDELTVLVDGNAVQQPCNVSPGATPSYTCTYVVPATETSGTKAVTVSTTDEAGNSDFASTTVIFDLNQPQILSSAAIPPVVGINQQEILSVVASKSLASPPVLNVSGPATIAFTSGSAGLTYTYQATTASLTAAAAGTYTSTVTLTDLLGNTATYVGPSFVVDTVAPQLTNVRTLNGSATPATRFSAISPFNALVVTFDWSGWMNTAPSTVTATLGSETLLCSAPTPWVAPYTYSCPHTVTTADPEGTLPVSIRATDEAGNTASGGATVTLDFTPPSLTLAQASPAIVGASQVETLTLTASEALGATPVLTASGVEGPTFAFEAGTAYAFVATIAGSPAVTGSVTMSVQLVDLVGNSATLGGPGFTVDTVLPVISGVQIENGQGPTRTLFSAQQEYNDVQLVFNASKALARYSVNLGNSPMPCVVVSDAYTCSYTETGQDPAGTYPISITGEDEAGNPASAGTAVTFDYTPPALAAAPALAYIPGQNNVLNSVTAATVGTAIQASFTMTKLLMSSPAVASLPAGLTMTQASASGTSYVYSALIATAGTPPDGSYSLSITATDVVGNSATLTPAAPVAVVKTTPPALPPSTSTPQSIVYSRNPWGTASTNQVPAFSVTGVAGAATGFDAVIVYDGSNPATAGEIGRQMVAPGGAFSITLPRFDRPVIYIAGVDNAGNLSTAAPVHDISWTASLDGRTSGSSFVNPNLMYSDIDFVVTGAPPILVGPLPQPGNFVTEVPSYTGLVLPSDGLTLTTTAITNAWQEESPSASPPERYQAAATYQAASHTTVLFGGDSSSSGSYLSDTWTWNGTTWTNLTPGLLGSNPSARDQHALAYDPLRQVSVLFGGAGLLLNPTDTWEWNGSSWTEKSAGLLGSNTAGARLQPAMAADSTSVVLFGGWNGSNTYDADTWKWSGTTWTNVSPTTSPPARYGHAMAFDSARGVTVLFGGVSSAGSPLADTWEWSAASSTWTHITPTSSPSARSGHSMAYDSARGVTLLFGGTDSTGQLDDLWQWNGAVWRELTQGSVNPPVRTSSVLVYDSAFEQAVLFGGLNLADTWLAPSDTTRRPAQIAIFSFAAAGATNPTVEAMTLTGWAGGSGNTTVLPTSNTPTVGVAAPGASMAVWDDDGWEELATNTVGVGSAGELQSSTGLDSGAAAYLDTSTQTVSVALFSALGQGNGTTAPEVTVDYVELTVLYNQ